MKSVITFFNFDGGGNLGVEASVEFYTEKRKKKKLYGIK